MSNVLFSSKPSILSTVICTLLVTLANLLSLVTPAFLKYSTLPNGTCSVPNIFLSYVSEVFGKAAEIFPLPPGAILLIFLLILLNGTYSPVYTVLGVATNCSLLHFKTMFDRLAFFTII